MSSFFQYLESVMDSGYCVYLLIILYGAMYGLFRFSKLTMVYQVLTVYLFIVFTSESLSRALPYLIGSSAPNYHVLVPLQVVFYTYIFLRILNLSGRAKIFLQIAGVFVLSGCLINSFFIQSFYSIPSNGIMLLSLFVVTLTLLQFKNMLLHLDMGNLFHSPLFWFSIGGLIFYCVTFFVFTLFNINGGVPDWIYDLIWLCNLVMYTCYAYTLKLASGKMEKR